MMLSQKIFSFLFLCPLVLYAQNNKTDSLKEIITHFERQQKIAHYPPYIDALNEYAVMWHIRNLDTTLHYAQKALTLAQKKQYTLGEIEALRNLTTSYDLKGDFGEANKFLEKAIQLAEKEGNKKVLAKIYNNCGNLYFKKDTKIGLSYFFKALAIRQEIDDKPSISSTLLNIGSMYLRLKDYQNALKYYNESLEIKKQLKDERGIGLILGNIGNIYKEQKDFKKAKEYAFAATEQHDKIKDVSGKFYAYMMLADIYFEEKNDDACIKYAEMSYEAAKKIKAKQQIIQALKRLHEVCARRQDFAKAYQYSLIHKQYADSMLNESNIKKNTEFDAKIAYQKKENILKNEQDKKLASQRFYTYLVGLALLFVSALGFIIYRSRQVQQKTNIQLEALNHTKDKLLAIIGHDLKSPINSLKGLLNLLNSQNISPEEFMLFAGNLQQNVEYLQFMLTNLLHWANAQMQGIETNPQSIDIAHIAEENIQLFSQIARQKNITLLNQITPEQQVWADKDQIDLIFRNLISNALKFTPKGGKITLCNENKGHFQQISIQDTGVGITPEKLAKLFLPTQHFTTHGTAGEKGTGLGLLLCKDFIENNQGKIWVESTLNQGTTFYFTLKNV